MKDDAHGLRELSLFTGAGGGILGSMLLGHRIVGAVEFNEYCCRVLEQRQRDGILERFPIFQTDIRDFVRHGYADLYKGRCDLISAGFPCQPFSVAGKRAGADDPRNMWPATIATVRAVRPRFCFFENVPGLLNSGYFGRIVADLAESGYGVRWRCLSAAELGAPHKRDRLWIVAHTKRAQGNAQRGDRQRRRDTLGRHTEAAQRDDGQADSDSLDRRGASLALATGQRCERTPDTTWQTRSFGPESITWWRAEPAVCRVVDGYAGRVAELQAAGNAQVASVAAAAWHLLTEDL